MALTKFTPINYQTVDYTDDPGGMKAFKESYDNAKNIAIEAMEKKKDEFMKDEIDALEVNMFAPKGTKMVMDDGKGGKRLNKGFYSIMNKTPEDAYRKARKKAEAAGLGRHAINRDEFFAQWQSMQKGAVQRQYQSLAEYGAKNGMTELENVLNKEGGQFNAYFQRFTDPYSELALAGKLPDKFIKNAKTRTETPGGFVIDEKTQTVKEVPWGQWGEGYGNSDVYTENGIRYALNWLGNRTYIDAPISGPGKIGDTWADPVYQAWIREQKKAGKIK